MAPRPSSETTSYGPTLARMPGEHARGQDAAQTVGWPGMTDRPPPIRELIAQRRSAPWSPWLLTGGVILWVIACLGAGVVGAWAGIAPETLRPLKQVNAIGVWMWVYFMTSSVAVWKGRSGLPWFLLGSLTMWGGFAATAFGGLTLGMQLGGDPQERVGLFALGMLLGFPVGIACTTVVSLLLWRSAPLPGAPCLQGPAEETPPASPPPAG